MERRVDHSGRHPLRDQGAQRRLAGAARELYPVAVADAALLGVVGMDLEAILFVPDHVVGAPRLGADIVLAENAAGRQQQRKARPSAFDHGLT
jgi:hypothetical protein